MEFLIENEKEYNNEYKEEYEDEYKIESEDECSIDDENEKIIEEKFQNAIISGNIEKELLSIIDLSSISKFHEIWKFKIYEELCLYILKKKNFSQFEKYFDNIIEIYQNIYYYKKDELFSKIINLFSKHKEKYSILTDIINIIIRILRKYNQTGKIIEIINILQKKYLIILKEGNTYFVIEPPKTKLLVVSLFTKNYHLIPIKEDKNFYSNMIFYFPISGNIISIQGQSIIIFDTKETILQKINYAHYKKINNLYIIDENHFISCSDDNQIITWNKKNNFFIMDKIIKNAHYKGVTKVIYTKNKMIISCSNDLKIKIWELVNNKYQNNTIIVYSTLKHNEIYEINNNLYLIDKFFSITYLEDKKLLISYGYYGIKFWQSPSFEFIFEENFQCSYINAFSRINEDEIIIGEKNCIIIISISKKKIIKKITNSFKLYSIFPLNNELFLIGGEGLSLYNNKNLVPIEKIFDKIFYHELLNSKLCFNLIEPTKQINIESMCLLKNGTIFLTGKNYSTLIKIDD